jgi:hypothetical protein
MSREKRAWPRGAAAATADGPESTGNGKINGLGPVPQEHGPQPQMMREPLVRDDSRLRQAGTMFSACGPFWPCVTSKLTFWPS